MSSNGKHLLHLLDSRALLHFSREFLDELSTGRIVNELLGVVGQEEVTELVVNILLSSLNHQICETLVETVYLLHTLLLLFLWQVVTIDMFGNAVNLLANLHH